MGQLAAYDDFRSGYYPHSTKTHKDKIVYAFTKTLKTPKETSYKKVITYLESISILKTDEEFSFLQSLAEDILLELKAQGYKEIFE